MGNITMNHAVFLHDPADDVGVAVVDLAAGTEAGAVTLDGLSIGLIKTVEDIPLGHKIAMHDIPKGNQVLEYGYPIGMTTASILKGAHVHTHNLKSLRWSR
jgi:(2R)-sulfolactate sulfo-lyase subunit alpha